jgi:hypothetical protein
MKHSKSYGVALIIGMIASMVTMSFHPTTLNTTVAPDLLARQLRTLVAVHACGLLCIPVLVFGFAGVTRRLGWERPAGLLAFSLYLFSAVAVMLAGIADGPVTAALVSKMGSVSQSEQQSLHAALSYNFQLNQACAKVFVVGSSLAFISWSVALAGAGTFARRVAILGYFTGGIALVGILTGHVRMSAHGFAVIVLLQAVWVILLGVWMLRPNHSLQPTCR